MKYIFVSLFILCFGSNLKAQFWLPIPDAAKLIEGRTLLVETDDFSCNPEIVTHLKKHWKLNANIVGKTSEEITAFLTPENAKNYLVLTGDQREEYKKSQGKILRSSTMCIAIYPGEHAGHRNNLELDREWIGKIGLPSCLSSEEDVLFFAQHMYNQLEIIKNQSASGNRKKSSLNPQLTLSLKSKTLLLPQEKMGVESSEFKRFYKAPTTQSSASTIKSAILNKESGKAYLTVLWSDKRFKWVLVAVDCSNGEILNYSKFDSFKPSLTKQKANSETEFLSIYRSKSKIGLMEMKYLGKEITKAEMENR